MNYSSKLNEYIGGMKLLKVMAANNVILKRLENLSFRILRAYWNEEKSHALLAFYMRAGPIVVVSVIIVFSFEILELSGSVVLVFLFVLMRLVPSVTAVRQNYHSYKIHKPSLDVVDDLIILASNVSEDMRGIIKFNKLQDSIDFKNVGFRYSDSNHDTLKSISLKIKKNSTVGIVGLSGSGKTTLLDLLVGLYQPTKGAIEVDGVELNRYEITSWRKSIGYVTQDVLLFDESLRDNILLREKNASVENINAAIETAFLKNVISNLDEGLNTNIGEKGHRLSGGERQRIALARALLGGPSIVILDEATSSLDAESENTIRERIDAISHNYTIIVVTHKLSTVRNADYIYVMEEGEIVEHGNYTDLLKNTSRFQELHDLQNT
jgi:ABC-type multidrug transport system fused ATPase/permease subunit